MNLKSMFSVGLLAITAAAGAAQAGVQAKVHLPFTAHWGQAVLTPGDYKITFPQPAQGVAFFTLDGDAGSRFIQSVGTDFAVDQMGKSQRSYLRLVNVDGSYFVSEFCSGVTGKTFSFAVPKAKHQVKMADRADLTLSVGGN